jgi:hypothetical protein
MSLRRSLLGFLLCISTALSCAQLANAQNGGQAARYTTGGGYLGTRATISGSGATNSTGLVFAAVAIQDNVSGGTKMLQIGELQITYDDYANDCNQALNVVGIAVERTTDGVNYTCDFWSTADTRFGVNHRIAVVAPGSGGWDAYLDGNRLEGPFTLGMSGGYPIARAEAFWTTTAPSYNVTWGPSGYTPWQYTTNHGNTYTTIVNSGAAASSSGWNLDNTPSPFRIYR